MRAELLILGVLHRGDFHPYAIKQRLQNAMVECYTDVDVGTLYYAIRQLAKEGLIEAVNRERVSRGGMRTIYGITPRGRERFRHLLRERFTAQGTVADTLYSALLFLHLADMTEVAKMLQGKIEWQNQALDELALVRRRLGESAPLGARYLMKHLQQQRQLDRRWLKELLAGVSGAAHPLWLTEWLCQELPLRPGMRVLDLGCGRALSSVFLHREFGVQVWAADLWFDSAENTQRVRDAGVADGVFPVQADARALPFETEFFDAIVAIDSFSYFGTDDLYLNYLARFLKPGGSIGIVGAGLMREMPAAIPEHLRSWWNADLCCVHSAPWWQQHWNRTGIVEVGLADTLAQGWQLWLEWMRTIAPDNVPEIQALEADRGEWLGYVRVVGRRRENAQLSEPVLSVPTKYVKQPLLRG